MEQEIFVIQSPKGEKYLLTLRPGEGVVEGKLSLSPADLRIPIKEWRGHLGCCKEVDFAVDLVRRTERGRRMEALGYSVVSSWKGPIRSRRSRFQAQREESSRWAAYHTGR